MSESEWRGDVAKDNEVITVMEYIMKGWPCENSSPAHLQAYSKVHLNIPLRVGYCFALRS